MADLSQLSDSQLKQLYTISQLETGAAPDSSTVTSPKGAQGSMQVEPATQGNPGFGVRPSNGTPQDTAREGRDYYLALEQKYGDATTAAIAYNMGPGATDKWLKAGGDPSKLPNETLKYAYNFDAKNPQSFATPPKQDPVAGMSDDDLKNAYAASQGQGQGTGIMANVEGLGLQAANLGAAGLEAIPIAGAAAIGAGRRMFEGQDLSQALGGAVQQAGQNFEQGSATNLLGKLGVNTSNAQASAGYQLPQKALKFATQTAPNAIAPLLAQGIANQTGYNKPITPKDVQDVKNLEQGLLIGVPAAGELGRFGGAGEGAPGEVADKFTGTPDEAAAPSAAKPVMGPNEGPQRPAITVGRNGVADTNLGTDQDRMMLEAQQAGLDLGAERQQTAEQNDAGDLFPETTTDTTGYAEPYNPNQEANVEPFSPDTMQGQSRLDLTGETLSNFNQAVRNGEVFQQGDLFNDLDQRRFDQYADEVTRPLTSEEFEETMHNLTNTEGSRFSAPSPDDPVYGMWMDNAYGHYLDTIRDDQGALFDRPTMAKNFVEGAARESMDRRIADHPIVKANQTKVDSLTQQIADASSQGHATGRLQAALDVAQSTLDKSKDNIGKVLGKDPTLPWEKDGVVNMYTFGNIPEMFRSIGAVLKGLHGLVFKALDRMIPQFKNLDSTAKIFGQGIKDYVNRQANRDWSQTVNERPVAQMSGVPGLKRAVDSLNPHAQEDLSPEELKQQFNQAPDLSSSKVGNALRNNLLQGGLMLNDFSQHPLVKFTTDAVAKAFRSADKWARENLLNKATGLGPMIKAMPLKDFTEIRSLMETYEGMREFSENELKSKGFGDKQIEYYKRSVELQKEALNKFNTARVTLGLPPVDARIAHIAGYFTGDFKQIVKDAEGRVVAVLGHNNRFALSAIAKRFQELHPDGADLDMGKPTLNRNVARGENSFHGFMNILNEMSKTNADVERLVQAYHDVQSANTMKLSQMSNRAKFKRGPENRVGGAEGQKLWQSMQQNAIDGGKQQLKYLDSVNRWSEFAQAADKAQRFIDDPEVKAPNAQAVSQRYIDNQMHRNLGDLSKFTNSFANGIADVTGVGPSQMRTLAGYTKTGLLNMFVGLGNLKHSLVTLIQPLWGIPMVNSVMKARGADFGIHQATSAFKAMSDVKDILQSLASKQPIRDPFLRAANQYAKDNDTFNTSQFNMGSVNHPSTPSGTALHINVTVPESGSRAFTYMYYARLLKDADTEGTMSDKEIFGTAHNAVQKVMADYNREAQAPVFNKLGFLGDLTRMLTTFKMNQISQYATAGKMLSEGKVAPMATMLATSLASAGLRGFIGYNIANGLLGQVTTWATKQGMMKQPTNLDQIVLHMLHGMNPHLADALNFGATSALGIDMTGSLSHADDIPDDPLGTLIPEGNPIGKMLGSVGTMIAQPNSHNAEAALYDSLPNSGKGIMEDMAYTDKKGNFFDPHTGKLVDNRSPLDQAKRAGGFRPLDESRLKLEARTTQESTQQMEEARQGIIKRMLSDADSNDGMVPNIQEYARQYIGAEGNVNELVTALKQHNGLDKALNVQQRAAGIPRGSLTAAERYVRAQGFTNDNGK
jgi:hypothetical protein